MPPAPADRVEIAHFAETEVARDVPDRSSGDDLARIRAHPRLRHAERQEDLVAHPLREWAAGDSLYDDRRQAERRVVVVELRAGLVLQRRLPVDHLDRLRPERCNHPLAPDVLR